MQIESLKTYYDNLDSMNFFKEFVANIKKIRNHYSCKKNDLISVYFKCNANFNNGFNYHEKSIALFLQKNCGVAKVSFTEKPLTAAFFLIDNIEFYVTFEKDFEPSLEVKRIDKIIEKIDDERSKLNSKNPNSLIKRCVLSEVESRYNKHQDFLLNNE